MGRPGEQHITEVEDEGRRFREGHDYVLEGEGAGEGGADREDEREIVKYL